MASRKLVVEVVGDSGSLERTFRRSSAASSAFGRDISKAGRGALVATVGFRGLGRSIAFATGAFLGGAGLTAALKSSISGFATFTEAMQKAVGLAGVAQKNIAGFSAQILRLGPEVGKSPEELANAFFFVASSGIAASKAMDVVTASAKASAAGLGETQTVADAVTSAMNAYGPAVLSAQKATDVLVATVREGKGEASQFAGVIGNVTAFASQLGVSFNEVGAALAAMTRLGTDAQTATIQLQAVFASLVKVSPKASKAFASVGLDTNKLLKTLAQPQGLLKFLNQVKDAFGNNTKALARAFPNIRAVRGLFALVGKQADSVRGIFERMTNVTGSLKTAFDAVSKDTAQRFRQLRASAQVLGISIGAIFAPLAGKVADALAGAADAFTKFVGDLGAAKTVQAKLNVVWQGAREAAAGARDALTKAVASIDFGRVFASARGIADSLQQQIDGIDFSDLGKRIGKGFSDAAKVALPAAKEIGQRINNAVKSIDFVAFGKALGPGLAAALATAFVTLTDPSFWIKNWDLALSVGLVAFGGSIGKVAGALAADLLRPFALFGAKAATVLTLALGRSIPNVARAAGDLVLAVTGALERLAPSVAKLVLDAFTALPRLVLAPIERLAKAIGSRFEKLGTLTKFVIKVLGVQAAINIVTDFAKKVGGVFASLGHKIADAFGTAMRAVERFVLEAALKIVKALDFKVLGQHVVPGLHAIVTALENQLDDLAAHTKTSIRKTQAAIDSLHGRKVTVTVSVQTQRALAKEVGRSPRIQAHDSAAAEAQAAATGGSKEQEKTAKKMAGAADAAAAVATKAASQAKGAKKRAIKAFQALLDALSLKEEEAAATKTLRDDLAVQRRIQAAILAEIKIEGKTTDLERKLFESRQKTAEIRNQMADQARANRQAQQFVALGLTASGEKRGPSVKNLQNRLASLREQIKGTVLDTPKTQAELQRIAKVLSGAFGKVGRDVRDAILQMFQDLSNALSGKSSSGGPQTKFKVVNTSEMLKGLGLTIDQTQELRRRLSRTGPGGTTPQDGIGGAFGLNPALAAAARRQTGVKTPLGPLTVTGGGSIINVNNATFVVKDVEEFERQLERRAKKTTKARTGPAAGRNL